MTTAEKLRADTRAHFAAILPVAEYLGDDVNVAWCRLAIADLDGAPARSFRRLWDGMWRDLFGGV